MINGNDFYKWLKIFRVYYGSNLPPILTYLGSWNANTNTPTLTSSVGTANTFYIVSVAGNTNLNGITTWNVGDWAAFNGSVWTRIPDYFPAIIDATMGGTGVSNPTAHTIPIAEGASNFNFIGPLTTGQVLGGVTGTDPKPYTFVAGTNMTSIVPDSTTGTFTFNAANQVPAASTLTGDTGLATESSNNINVLTGAPGGCGATISFDGAGNNLVFQVADNNGNVFLGPICGSSGFPGQFNYIFGNEGFSSATNGSENSGFGHQAFKNILTGSYNTGFGAHVGSNYTGAESSNALISNAGVVGDNHIARFGTRGTGNGQQSRCFLPGGYGVATLPGARLLAQDVNGELCEAPSSGSEVIFQNNYYVTDNGDDSGGGDGSLSKPFFTIPHTLAVILALSPSASNRFIIYDQRTTDIVEDFQLLPFVEIQGNGAATYHGDISLHSSFSSVASDCYSGFSGYKEWLAGSTLTLDFSAIPTTHQILINLYNVVKAPINYSIIGNDSANFNSDTFRVNEFNFNTSGRDPDGSFWQANCTMASGVTRRIRYCEGTQISSITKSLGSSLATTTLDIAFCNIIAFQPSLGTLAIINSGGINNQPDIKVNIAACNVEGFFLNLDITNDGNSAVNFTLDNSVTPNINSANSLTNIAFNNNVYLDYSKSQYSPINFATASWTDPNGIFVYGGTYGSMLKGIDNRLGPDIKGFQLTWNNVGPPATITIGPGSVLDSTKTFIMSLGSPVTLDTTSASIDNGGSWTPDVWYAVWLYQNSTTLATTMKLSLSFSSPAAIGGYDKVAYVRSIKAQSTGTNILAVIQRGINSEITYYFNDTDAALDLLVTGSAVGGAPGTFSCAGAQSPISNEINLQYNFTPGLARAGDNFSISNADDPTLPLAIYSGLVASLTVNGLTGFLPTNSSQNLSYFVDNALDQLNLIAVGYKESL